MSWGPKVEVAVVSGMVRILVNCDDMDHAELLCKMLKDSVWTAALESMAASAREKLR